MSLNKKQQIFTKNIALLILEADRLCIGLTFSEAYRPLDMQLLYYHGYTLRVIQKTLHLVKGRRKSTTMSSKHLKRLAVDFNFFVAGSLTYNKEDLQPLGDYWESLDLLNVWGGNWTSFVDTPHFEMK